MYEYRYSAGVPRNRKWTAGFPPALPYPVVPYPHGGPLLALHIAPRSLRRPPTSFPARGSRNPSHPVLRCRTIPHSPYGVISYPTHLKGLYLFFILRLARSDALQPHLQLGNQGLPQRQKKKKHHDANDGVVSPRTTKKNIQAYGSCLAKESS